MKRIMLRAFSFVLLGVWTTTPAKAHDYLAVYALDNAVGYIEPATVKTDGNIKTFWADAVFIRTDNLGIDWMSEHDSIDCKNDRIVTLRAIGYRTNGDVVADTDSNPSIPHRWTDIPPGTVDAAEEDAVCRGTALGTESGASFMDIVPVARVSIRGSTQAV